MHMYIIISICAFVYRMAPEQYYCLYHIIVILLSRRAIAVHFETEQWPGFGDDMRFIFYPRRGIVHPHTTDVLQMFRAVSTIDSANCVCANGIAVRLHIASAGRWKPCNSWLSFRGGEKIAEPKIISTRGTVVVDRSFYALVSARLNYKRNMFVLIQSIIINCIYLIIRCLYRYSYVPLIS